ncbi:MAG: type II secretion system protein [Candidatus Buchananbacteria bacterium]|nr:type II secretion system protein [Candidatus Buchananbacteria bacterium]
MKSKKGFTLIEFLILLAIIALVIIVALWGMNSARQKARDARRLAVVQQIQSALNLYFFDFNAFPAPSNQPVVLGTGSDCNGESCSTISAGRAISNVASGKIYMSLIPGDPSGKDGSKCSSSSSTVCNYAYQAVGSDSSQYEIWFYLETATGGYQAGPNCATELKTNSGSCLH